MHADIADEDRLLGQRATDLVRGALRVDRDRVVAGRLPPPTPDGSFSDVKRYGGISGSPVCQV